MRPVFVVNFYYKNNKNMKMGMVNQHLENLLRPVALLDMHWV